MQGVTILRETGPTGKAGVATTHERKLQFVALLEQLMLEHAISFNERIISDDEEDCMKTLKRQLGTYRKINSELGKATVFAVPKVTYSGKVTEDGRMLPNSLQDDLCITLQMLAFWSSYVLQRKCKFLDYTNLYDDLK